VHDDARRDHTSRDRVAPEAGPIPSRRRAGEDLVPWRDTPPGASLVAMAHTLAGPDSSPTLVAPEAGAGPRPEHRRVILAVLCVSLLIVSLDSTILNVALPTIVRAMHATSSQLQWIVDAYVIVFAGLLLALGSLGDRVGRKWVFMAGLALFAAGSAVSAFSVTPDRLIAARAFMGIGGAAIMPSTLSILASVFTGPRERLQAIGVWSGTTGLGVAVGPVAGGWLLAHYWWGSVFLVNVPIALLGLLAAAWCVPNSRNPASKRPDPIGVVLSIAGMALLLWGIIEAPNRTWTSPVIIGAIVVAGVVLAVFVWWERRSTHPMLEMSFFGSRRFSAAIGAMGLVIFALMGALFLLTQYLQFSLGYSALQTGLRIAPIAAVLLVAAPLSTLAVRHVGSKPVVFAGLALIAVGLALLARITVHGTYLEALPALFLMGTGVGLALAPCTESVMGSLPAAELGVGSATNSTFLQLGGALGVGVLGSLLNTRYSDRMGPALAPYLSAIPHSMVQTVQGLITGSVGGALAVAAQVGGTKGAELARVARESFVSGMDLALLVATVVVAVAAFVVLFVLPTRGAPGTDPTAAGPSGRRDGR
jgi:EmrB/QacA subfamily drug resistance transporter